MPNALAENGEQVAMKTAEVIDWLAVELANELLGLEPWVAGSVCRILLEPMDMVFVAMVEGLSHNLREENLSAIANYLEHEIWLEPGLESWYGHPWREDLNGLLGTPDSPISAYVEILARAVDAFLVENQGDVSGSKHSLQALASLEALRDALEVKPQVAAGALQVAAVADAGWSLDDWGTTGGDATQGDWGGGSVIPFPELRESDPFM